LLKNGAHWKSPTEIAKECNVIFLMLGYPKDVESTVLGNDGLINHLKSGSIVIDHTTSSPVLSEKIANEL